MGGHLLPRSAGFEGKDRAVGKVEVVAMHPVPKSISLGAVLLLTSPFVAGCRSGVAADSMVQGGDAGPQSPVTVEVSRPEPAAAAGGLPSSLYLENDVKVTARADGIIERVLVDRGQTVKAGQALAVLETDIAMRDLEIAEQDLRLALADYERARPLNEQRLVSPQEFQRAEIARDRAESRVGLARARFERCTVRAPFEGLIVERWAVLGGRVREEDSVPLFRIVSREPLRARVNVPEVLLSKLTIGAKARIDLAGGAGRYPARVVFVSPAVDPGSGTAPVIVETAAAPAVLKPGTSVTVSFDGLVSEGSPSLLVPREAVVSGSAIAGGQARLLVAKAGRAVARRVRILETRGGSVLVVGELAPEDDVIVGAGAGLREGEPVAIGSRPR